MCFRLWRKVCQSMREKTLMPLCWTPHTVLGPSLRNLESALRQCPWCGHWWFHGSSGRYSSPHGTASSYQRQQEPGRRKRNKANPLGSTSKELGDTGERLWIYGYRPTYVDIQMSITPGALGFSGGASRPILGIEEETKQVGLLASMPISARASLFSNVL